MLRTGDSWRKCISQCTHIDRAKLDWRKKHGEKKQMY